MVRISPTIYIILRHSIRQELLHSEKNIVTTIQVLYVECTERNAPDDMVNVRQH